MEYKKFQECCKSAGIEDLTVHDLRHTAASFLINHCGIDVVTASKILGHSSIDMTMRYLHPTDENRRKGIEGLGNIFKQARHKVDKEEKADVEHQPVSSLLH